MARFLSVEWFDEVDRQAPPRPDGATSGGDLVLEQVVQGTPDGEIRYRVVLSDGAAYLERPPVNPGNGSAPAPDVTIACDWATAVALAQGRLAAQAALMEGRLRVNGNLARLAERAGDLAGLDAVPEPVRRQTSYPA